MLKKIVFSTVFASTLILTFVFSKASGQEQSELTKENVEALAFWDVKEWWNRKDYDCVPVTCNCIAYEYPSDVAASTEKGKGGVAHTWNCTGCGDCGWTMA